MEADEALARMLQDEEMRAAEALQGQLRLQQQQPHGGGDGMGAFHTRLQSMMETALRCEDRGLQERARAVMPLARLRAAAEEAAGLAARLGGDVATPAREDLLVKQLLAWFKAEFFTWVDTLPCPRCASSATRPEAALTQPLPEDLAHGAQRVELHRCASPGCGGSSRFPRYNNPGKLLEPGCRRGRCGEWANAFLLCCRAAGLTARYVSDWSDHVWTEYYSHSLRRWIHLDSCEASYDQPLLYETGWGKAVSYVVAAGVCGLTDVTPRYTAKWRREVVARRTLVPERWLAQTLDSSTTALRAGWAAPKRLAWLGRDAEDRVELLKQRLGVPGQQQTAVAALPGRQTGSLAWRQERGETGASSAPTSTSPPAARAGTSYRLAADGAAQLPPVFAAAGRLSGGACAAAGHNETQEVVERLFDGRVATKWLDFGAAGLGGSSWVEYRLPADQPAAVLGGYELISANDSPERDPADWQLEGVSQSDFEAGRVEQWTPLDRRSGVRFPARLVPLAFTLAVPSPPCRRLRLAIAATADPRAANSVQLACLNLYGICGSSSTAASRASSSSSTGCGESPLERLRDVVASVAGTSTGPGAGGVDAAGLALLGRLLHNVRREPKEAKVRKVRCSRVQPLLDHPVLRDVFLSHVRFRPLIMPALPAAGGAGLPQPGVPAGEDVFLLLAADPSGLDLQRVGEVLAVLPLQ